MARTAKEERDEDPVLIEESAEAPREAARDNRRKGPPRDGKQFVRDERGPRGPRGPRKGAAPHGGGKGKPGGGRKGPRSNQY